MSGKSSEQIRAGLDHPIIDGDGHTVEFMPLVFDYLKEVAGNSVYERYVADRPQPLLGRGRRDLWYGMTPQERQYQRATRPSFWVGTGDTYDRATAMLPDLRRARLDELGIDYSVLYPTAGLEFPLEEDDEVRPALCRAANMMNADLYADHADRMTPAAIIPVHTPEEAITELEFAVNELGLKTMYMPAQVRRPVPRVAAEAPQLGQHALYLDLIGLDSPYDYDPLWAKCVELGVAPTSHSGGMWGARSSTSNYMYNHMGHFAQAGEAFCKALFMGGVTRRFPTLKFAFLEGGAAWACTLYGDMVGHWEKRNVDELKRTLNPANIDISRMVELFSHYGGKVTRGREQQIEEIMGQMAEHLEDLDNVDDWAACKISSVQDVYDLFVPNFYFGCEADDPSNLWAFKGKTRLKAIFSSDIGHWDVPDIRECVVEAYELVEDGDMTGQDFREFVFTNPVELQMGMNPDFFKGTVVEEAARQEMARASA